MSEAAPASYDDTMIVQRAPLSWPDGCRVAVSIIVSCEYYEMQPPEGAFIPPNVPGGFGRAPYPDVRAFSQREYGNRVGIFRIIEALDKAGIAATAAVDANVAARYPHLIAEMRQRQWEIAAHGIAVTRVVSNRMSQSEEREYVRTTLDRIEAVAGVRPVGWHGPEYGQSERSPTLLAEHGVRYMLDWPNDEQPYLMRTPAGPIVSLPIALELDDVIAGYHRRLPMSRWRQAVGEALDQVLRDSRPDAGRHLLLNLHPWFIGQPHRIGFLEDVLADVKTRDDVGIATAGELAAHFLAQSKT